GRVVLREGECGSPQSIRRPRRQTSGGRKLMRRLFTVVLLLLTAVAVALPAGAGAVGTITLRLGGGVAGRQTHPLGAGQGSKTLVPGQKLVACYFWGPSGPVPKTYSVALAVDGKVALGRVGANGKLKVVTTRGGTTSVPPQQSSSRKGTLRQVG